MFSSFAFDFTAAARCHNQPCESISSNYSTTVIISPVNLNPALTHDAVLIKLSMCVFFGHDNHQDFYVSISKKKFTIMHIDPKSSKDLHDFKSKNILVESDRYQLGRPLHLSLSECEREYHTGCLREYKKIYLKVCFHFGGIGIGITYSDVKWIVFLGKDVSDDNNRIPKNIFVRKRGSGAPRWSYFSRWFCFKVELLFKMVLFSSFD
ncbi:unnamed protein product [Lactuca saligna]|uniref:Uncharacterized protein n=1 Tax=Lactuca saligna TaxID=75948 RepID=A0AA35VYA4_LACSI|nr:unnamed protein product [Lactuca saligna]